MAPVRLLLCAAVLFYSFLSGTCLEINATHSNSSRENITAITHGTEEHDVHSIHVASWRFSYVKYPLTLCIFVLFAGLVKLGFHHANFLSSIIPESCILILLGTIVGAILNGIGDTGIFPTTLQPDLFFLYLLPPIILEAAYSLHDRVFFENFGTILIYAVIGTLLNCFLIGPLLYGLAAGGAMGGGISLNFTQALLFAALIVAVDPVAVLAIFQEVGVNNTLYFLVFGESLLNDAVTVVLYNTMKIFNEMDSVPAEQVFLGIANFLTVSLGGTAIGLLFGVGTAIMTKYTQHVRVVEPMAMLLLAYSSYMVAELVHFSGIISMIACGLTQSQYAIHNISTQSQTTVKYFTKMLGAISDAVIFLFLGIALVGHKHVGHAGFVCWTLLLALAVRFVVTFGLTYLLNRFGRLRKVSLEEQFIMAYGGLRGAVCFSLVIMLVPTGLTGSLPDELRSIFVTTTLILVIFTVFVQGITIKPLTKLLHISSAEEKTLTLSEEINTHVTDHVLSGIEEVMGHKGENYLRAYLDHYDNKYFKRWLQRNPMTKDEDIMALYEEIALQQHYDNLAGSTAACEQYMSNLDLVLPGVELQMDDDKDVRPSIDKTSVKRRVFSTRRGVSTKLKSSVERPMSEDIEKMVGNPGVMYRQVDKTRDMRESKVIDNPTPLDLRRMMVTNPAQSIHRRAGRNMTKDDGRDLATYLHDKHLRTQRFKRHMSISLSPLSSALLRRRSMDASPLAHSSDEDEDQGNHCRAKRSMSVPQAQSPQSMPGSPNMGTITEEDEETGSLKGGPRKNRSKTDLKRAMTIDTSDYPSNATRMNGSGRIHEKTTDISSDNGDDEGGDIPMVNIKPTPEPGNGENQEENNDPDDGDRQNVEGINIGKKSSYKGHLFREDAIDKKDDSV